MTKVINKVVILVTTVLITPTEVPITLLTKSHDPPSKRSEPVDAFTSASTAARRLGSPTADSFWGVGFTSLGFMGSGCRVYGFRGLGLGLGSVRVYRFWVSFRCRVLGIDRLSAEFMRGLVGFKISGWLMSC